jgi:hypothetical protein
MRSANLDNMFAPLLASDWINQLHAQTPLQQLMLKSEKYFMKFVSPSDERIGPSVPYASQLPIYGESEGAALGRIAMPSNSARTSEVVLS